MSTQRFTSGNTAVTGQTEREPQHTHETARSILDIVGYKAARMCNMTFEESSGDNSSERLACAVFFALYAFAQVAACF